MALLKEDNNSITCIMYTNCLGSVKFKMSHGYIHFSRHKKTSNLIKATGFLKLFNGLNYVIFSF